MKTNRLDEIQIFYEISIAIGEGSDLSEILRNGLMTILRKLNCSAGGIILNSAPSPQLACCVPRSIDTIDAFQKALEIVDSTTPADRQQPIVDSCGTDSYHLLPLGGEGLLILIRNDRPLSRRILYGLLPIAKKFALAIQNCHQRKKLEETVAALKKTERELQSYQDELEEKVKVRTKELENESRKHLMTANSLRQSEARHRLFLEALPDPVVAYDHAGQVLYQNSAFDRVFGWEQSEHTLAAKTFVPYSCQSQTAAMIRQLLNGEQLDSQETTRLTKNNKAVRVALSAMQQDKGTGKNTPLVLVYRDITRQRQLENELRHAQKMQAMDTLAGGIAHDFNNLLQVISGNTQLLMMRQTTEGREHNLLSGINHASRKAANLVKQLLTASHKTSSSQEIIDLNVEIGSTVKLLHRTLPKMISIETELSEDLPLIMGDHAQIEQVVLNLANNAQAAMAGRGCLEIRTKTVHLDAIYCQANVGILPGEYVLLEMSDNGCGIDARTKEHIFEPFFTTKDVGEGTGLGLSMVYKIVKTHNGHIQCYSEPGKGTTFRILLPSTTQRKEQQKLIKEEITQLPNGTGCVLVVDDEELVASMAQEMLVEYGYRVLHARSGEEALMTCSEMQEKIDMVLLDLGMPGIGGEYCLKELVEQYPKSKVLVASGYTTKEQKETVLKLGAMDFIGKPYELRSLITKVNNILSPPQR